MATQLNPSEGVEPVEQARSFLVERIEQGSLKLPLLPRAASQVMSIISDPKADAARLSALIHQDQTLAGHLLRIANSPAYMPRSPIVSLQQAIAWLGLDVLSEIAFTISIQQGVFRADGYTEAIKHLLRHALITALVAREIARQRRHNVESAFLCGLLHAIGKPVVLHVLSDVQKDWRTKLEWEPVERLMQEFHIPVGVMIADKWSLPAQVREAITYYADYSHAPTSKPALITALASRLATHLMDPTATDEESVRNHPVVRDLNLYPEDVAKLLEQGSTILDTAESMAV